MGKEAVAQVEFHFPAGADQPPPHQEEKIAPDHRGEDNCSGMQQDDPLAGFGLERINTGFEDPGDAAGRKIGQEQPKAPDEEPPPVTAQQWNELRERGAQTLYNPH